MIRKTILARLIAFALVGASNHAQAVFHEIDDAYPAWCFWKGVNYCK